MEVRIQELAIDFVLTCLSYKNDFTCRKLISKVNLALGPEGPFFFRKVKSDTASPTARHHCDVSSELCCPDTKPQRWAPPLVSRYTFRLDTAR